MSNMYLISNTLSIPSSDSYLVYCCPTFERRFPVFVVSAMLLLALIHLHSLHKTAPTLPLPRLPYVTFSPQGYL